LLALPASGISVIITKNKYLQSFLNNTPTGYRIGYSLGGTMFQGDNQYDGGITQH